ncbi:hypothetical protein OXIME_000228 [Oxyplasma meridianum]|uniref:Uncharacterized protein n=1 Tax=Oxyplasma meridianum TaxID=3073602 RepID=A0AAX4NG09_9ARCH
MNKYLAGEIIGVAIGIIGLALLIYETLITPSVGVHVGELPPIGILYGLLFAVGTISAIAIGNMNPDYTRKKGIK